MILGFAVTAPLALILLWPRAPFAGVALLALSHALLLYPILRPNVQWLGPVITRFDTSRRELWLTIDDGPTDDTPALLDAFDKLGVKATFFVKGELARRHPDWIAALLQRGHTVGNHSQTHPSASFWCLPPGRVAMEIDDCNRELRAITGAVPRWFRAPVGMKNPAVHPALSRRKMRLIGWSARAFDAVLSDPDEVVRRILPDVAPGAIVLLHQGRAHSLEVIERVVTELQTRGYAFVVPEDAQLRAV
ncbi:MAG: polysaccharide deacetylase family protein [Acidobacteriota bacterium]